MLLEDKKKQLKSSLDMYDNTLMDLRLKSGDQRHINTIERMRGEVQNELDCVDTAIKLNAIANNGVSNVFSISECNSVKGIQGASGPIGYAGVQGSITNISDNITQLIQETFPSVSAYCCVSDASIDNNYAKCLSVCDTANSLDVEFLDDNGMYDILTFEPLRSDMFTVKIKDIPLNRIVEFNASDKDLEGHIKFRESVEFFTELYVDEHREEFNDFTIEVDYLDVKRTPIYRKTFTGCKIIDVVSDTLNYEGDELLSTYVNFTFIERKIERVDNNGTTN